MTRTYRRHGKSLTKKSRTHKVFQLGQGYFKCISGSSNKEYTLRQFTDGSYLCNCDYHTKRGNYAKECSHTLAVRNYLAELEQRKIQGYGTIEGYKKSHQRYEDYCNGVIVTSRAR